MSQAGSISSVITELQDLNVAVDRHEPLRGLLMSSEDRNLLKIHHQFESPWRGGIQYRELASVVDQSEYHES